MALSSRGGGGGGSSVRMRVMMAAVMDDDDGVGGGWCSRFGVGCDGVVLRWVLVAGWDVHEPCNSTTARNA